MSRLSATYILLPAKPLANHLVLECLRIKVGLTPTPHPLLLDDLSTERVHCRPKLFELNDKTFVAAFPWLASAPIRVNSVKKSAATCPFIASWAYSEYHVRLIIPLNSQVDLMPQVFATLASKGN